MSQWYLFTGENDFALDTERQHWISKFAEKYGEENISRVEAKDLKVSALFDELSAAPFIAEKRLVVLDGLPRIDKEEVGKLIGAMHPGVIVLCRDSAPDKRLSSTKEFLKLVDVKEFPVRSPQELQAWLKQQASALGVILPPASGVALTRLVGSSERRLFSELQKVAAYVGKGNTIQEAHIAMLAVPGAEQVAWHIMDLFVAGKERECLALARAILETGESTHGLWSRLLWMVAQLALVSAAARDGKKNPANIAKETGVPFPTVRTLLPLGNVSAENIQREHAWFIATDVALKTGEYKATAEAPEELSTIIDRAVQRLCRLRTVA